MTSRDRTMILAVAAMISGCTGRDGANPMVLRDSSGIAIVENSVPTGLIRIDSTPSLELVGGSGSDAEFTTRLRVTRLDNGTIVAGDERGIRWFDRAGRRVAGAGRTGTGPGEFRQLDLLQAFGDSVLGYDFGLRRATVFDSIGRLGRITTLVASDSLGEAIPLGVLRDGRLLLGRYPAPTLPGLRRDSVTLAIATPTGAIERIVGRFPWIEQVVGVEKEGVSMRMVPFGRQSYWATFDTMVAVATNERFAFAWYGASGGLLRSVSRKWTPVPVTDRDVSAWIDERVEFFPAGMEERKAAFRAMMSAPPRPATMPPYEGIAVGGNGEVWVRERRPSRRSVTVPHSVFDLDGRWIGQLELDARMTVVAIGAGDIVAIWRDDDDVPRIRVHLLAGGPR